jgi:hypothetical protein
MVDSQMLTGSAPGTARRAAAMRISLIKQGEKLVRRADNLEMFGAAQLLEARQPTWRCDIQNLRHLRIGHDYRPKIGNGFVRPCIDFASRRVIICRHVPATETPLDWWKDHPTRALMRDLETLRSARSPPPALP